jgi:hypothetical protein
MVMDDEIEWLLDADDFTIDHFEDELLFLLSLREDSLIRRTWVLFSEYTPLAANRRLAS